MIRDRVLALAVAAAATFVAPVPAQVQWQQTAAGGGPGVTSAGYAFDTSRGELVVFGGESGPSFSNATRTWNGTTWLTLNPSLRPSARGRAIMCYDPLRNNVVLYGGFAGGNTFFEDTWIWNGVQWTQLSPAGPTPGKRSGAAAFFDPVRGTVVLFGGFGENNADLNDLWEWNGTSWAPIASLGGPPGRGAHRMVYDAANDVAVVHGGYSLAAGRTLDDTWVLSSSNWVQYLGTRPGSMCDQAMAWDAGRQRVVQYGGLFINIAMAQFNDLATTWDWEDGAWIQRFPGGSGPGARNHAFSYYDAANQLLRLSAGAAGGSPTGGSWTLSAVTPATAVAYGTACPTTSGLPQLTALNLPWLGDEFRLRLENLPVGTGLVLLVVGVDDTSWNGLPLPFDLSLLGSQPGCNLYTSIELNGQWTVTNDQVTIGLPLGNDPLLIMPWFTQVLIPDFGLAAPLKIAATQAYAWQPGWK